MDVDRYSQAQVLNGMAEFVCSRLGAQVRLEAGQTLGEVRRVVERHCECPLEFLEELAFYFGLRWGESRWLVLLGVPRGAAVKSSEWKEWERHVDEKVTVRDLACWIARRAPAVHLQPACLLGRPCQAAGAFLAIRRLVSKSRRIAPSTPIRQAISRAELNDLWGRLQWIAGDRLPELKRREWFDVRSMTNWCEAGLLVVAVFLAVGAMIWVGPWSHTACIVVVATITASAVVARDRLVDRLWDPLPGHIQSFGELARAVSTHGKTLTSPSR